MRPPRSRELSCPTTHVACHQEDRKPERRHHDCHLIKKIFVTAIHGIFAFRSSYRGQERCGERDAMSHNSTMNIFMGHFATCLRACLVRNRVGLGGAKSASPTQRTAPCEPYSQANFLGRTSPVRSSRKFLSY